MNFNLFQLTLIKIKIKINLYFILFNKNYFKDF